MAITIENRRISAPPRVWAHKWSHDVVALDPWDVRADDAGVPP
jgi:hypothetical protein